MIKRRESTPRTLDPKLAKEIEEFGSTADKEEDPLNQLDPTAKTRLQGDSRAIQRV